MIYYHLFFIRKASVLKQARAVYDRQSPKVGLRKDFQEQNGLSRIGCAGSC